jgi:hypothetical protein
MIAVLTTPRLNGFHYARQTIPRVVEQARQGSPGRDVVVVVDGHWEGEPIAGTELVELGTTGHARAYLKMARLAQMRHEHLLALEDDIELVADAIPYMDDFEVPRDVALVQFMSRVATQGSPHGLLRTSGPIRGFQAVKWPFRTLALLAQVEPEHIDPCIVFGKWLRETNARAGMHIPDLVRHVGEISCYGATRKLEHTAGTTWVEGGEFSARRNLQTAHAEGRYR